MSDVSWPVERLCILGGGTMGTAILSGLFTSGYMDQYPKLEVIVCIHRERREEELLRQFTSPRVKVYVRNNADACRWADVVIICLKPQQMPAAFRDLNFSFGDKVVVSIVAGVSLNRLQGYCVNAHVIRAMPNTPCRILQGMTVLSCRATVPDLHQRGVERLFQCLGRVLYLDEKHLDAVTALSGSGPAFACVILEALADGGVMLGLPRQVAFELAAQAMQGAARLVLETGEHPAQVKDAVTTPGGCTIAGLLAMEDGRIRSTLARAIQEAARVAAGLGGDGS